MVYPAIASGRKLLMGVCCNTFHDEPIFRPFLQRLREPWDAGLHGHRFAVDLTAGGLEACLPDTTSAATAAQMLDVEVVNMPLQVYSPVLCALHVRECWGESEGHTKSERNAFAGDRRSAPRCAARGRHLLRRCAAVCMHIRQTTIPPPIPNAKPISTV